jgi:hypothetical protein
MTAIATALLTVAAMAVPISAAITTNLIMVVATVMTFPTLLLLVPVFVSAIIVVLYLHDIGDGRNDLNSGRCSRCRSD